MADADPLDRRARDLLTAYRTHAGPSPAAARRLLADVHRSAAAEGLALTRPAPPVRRAAGSRQWLGVAVVGLIAAAVIAAIRLAPDRLALRTGVSDGAAALHAAGDGESEPVKSGAPHDRPHAPETAPRPAPGDSSREVPDIDAPAVQPRVPAPRGARRPLDGQPPPAPPPATIEPSPPESDALARELAFMRAVNRELSAGAPARALALLAEYPARFPGGRLREESEALRAVATCAAEPGRAPEAAAAFLQAYPASMSAERVRRACGDPGR